MNRLLAALATTAGVHFMGVDADLQREGVANNFSIAMDAQPSLVTTSNSGIPAWLSSFIDPKMIDVLVTPMKAAIIAGQEVKKGDWTTEFAFFPVIESTGEVSSYGDYSNNGVAGANTNYPERQSYHYQLVTRYGERELEKAALARIDWANRLNLASVLTLNKYQNQTYFFGVEGLKLYGLLNDPALEAPIAPLNVSGKTSWDDKDALGVYGDIQALYEQLQSQASGLIDLDTPMKLVMSPIKRVALTKVTQYNVNVATMLKDNFPNMTIETAPEYSTTSGELVQLIVEELEGQRTVEVAFTEKLRAHPVVVGLSSFQQKKSQGTWGAIVYRPFLIAQMLGV